MKNFFYNFHYEANKNLRNYIYIGVPFVLFAITIVILKLNSIDLPIVVLAIVNCLYEQLTALIIILTIKFHMNVTIAIALQGVFWLIVILLLTIKSSTVKKLAFANVALVCLYSIYIQSI